MGQQKAQDLQRMSETGISDQRQRYFEGKYMTARDFRDEQEYFLSHQRAHNRLLHGWGVACGLSVSGLEREDCWARWIKISAGLAIDCYGRELIVRDEWCLELPDEFPQRHSVMAETPQPEKPNPPDDADALAAARQKEREIDYLLCLEYHEEKIEPVPALLERDCDPVRMDYNRVREEVCLVVKRRDQMEPDCWIVQHNHPQTVAPPDDCGDTWTGPAGNCLDSNCRCGGVVPIALVRARVDENNRLVRGFRLINRHQAEAEAKNGKPFPHITLSTHGRHRMPTPPTYLTHIVDINWPHGEQVTLSYVRRNMEGTLKVRFDRRILEANGHKTGISRFTFVVTYGGVQGDDEYLPFDPEHPPTLVGSDTAVFKIPAKLLSKQNPADNIENNIIRIKLLCDFILDCHENPVDGTHLGGERPTGNGLPGGVFESWFVVGDPYREHEAEEEE